MEKNHPHAFSLSSLTDKEFSDLAKQVEEERNRRHRCWRSRQDWVNKMCDLFLIDPYVDRCREGNTVIAFRYIAPYKFEVARARPVHGDTFDLDTGIAVAYAKVMGWEIPDFI